MTPKPVLAGPCGTRVRFVHRCSPVKVVTGTWILVKRPHSHQGARRGAETARTVSTLNLRETKKLCQLLGVQHPPFTKAARKPLRTTPPQIFCSTCSRRRNPRTSSSRSSASFYRRNRGSTQYQRQCWPQGIRSCEAPPRSAPARSSLKGDLLAETSSATAPPSTPGLLPVLGFPPAKMHRCLMNHQGSGGWNFRSQLMKCTLSTFTATFSRVLAGAADNAGRSIETAPPDAATEHT